jgi:hypothetical protein
MNTGTRLTMLALAGVAIAGCGTAAANRDLTTAESAKASPTVSTPAAAATTGTVLFHDDFADDRNGWGIVDDPVGGKASYAGGDYVWNFTGSAAHVNPEKLGQQYERGELKMRDVAVKADLTIVSGDGVAGVDCRETKDTDAEYQWYEFVVRDGYAAIRQADEKGNIQVLATTDRVKLPRGRRFTIEGVCVDDSEKQTHLTLRLGGAEVLAVRRPAQLGNGVPGLQAWTHPVHAPMEIHWHDFTITAAIP